MHAVIPLIFVTLAYAAQGELTPRIVGGRDAPDGKYPYQVSLKVLDRHNCGGSIIDRYNILTAAHCIQGRRERDVSVHAGTNYLNVTGEVFQVEKFVPHRGFNRVQLVNDIGLVHLKSPITFKPKVQPIKLSTNDAGTEGNGCTLTGWGRTRVNGASSNSLQEIDLLINPQTYCKSKMPRVQPSNVCTLTKAGQGACYGDSGGPLVINGTQIGIVSYGRPCAVGLPDVYTRVSSYKDWINANKKK